MENNPSPFHPTSVRGGQGDALEGRRSRNETLIHSGRIGPNWEEGNFLTIWKELFLEKDLFFEMDSYYGDCWSVFMRGLYNLKIRIVIFESNR